MNLSRIEVETELTNLSAADIRRIKIMARTYALGLVYLSAEDLMQETFTKLLMGNRVFPRNVRPVTVVISAMHSEASNCREREQTGAIDHHVDVSAMSQSMDDDEATAVVIPTNEVTPERILLARRSFAAIEALVADDADLQDVATAWSLELRGKDAAKYLGWDMNRYEAARKRLMRRLESMTEDYK
ncbi:MAG TPA: hypothetical protein VFP33_13075 [Gallionella sp.]|nr:hypothetical protein [Gallionella sp.]